MERHIGKPKFSHYCNKCQFLGQCIGGMHIHDLYVCNTMGPDRSPTLIARYGNEDHEYLSIDSGYAHPNGHSELWAARELWVRLER